jgi:hypothetical protein
MADSLIDRLYIVLEAGIPEFKKLSMDRQGEICITFAKIIEQDLSFVELDKVIKLNG